MSSFRFRFNIYILYKNYEVIIRVQYIGSDKVVIASCNLSKLSDINISYINYLKTKIRFESSDRTPQYTSTYELELLFRQTVCL